MNLLQKKLRHYLKLLLLPWPFLQVGISLVSLLGVISQFPMAFGFPYGKSIVFFKAKCFRGSSFCYRSHRLGSAVAHKPLTPQGEALAL